MPGEQKVDPLKRHTYFENYLIDEEMKESVGKIMVQIGQTQGEEKQNYLTKESTLFNTHTKEFIEGYADEN